MTSDITNSNNSRFLSAQNIVATRIQTVDDDQQDTSMVEDGDTFVAAANNDEVLSSEQRKELVQYLLRYGASQSAFNSVFQAGSYGRVEEVFGSNSYLIPDYIQAEPEGFVYLPGEGRMVAYSNPDEKSSLESIKRQQTIDLLRSASSGDADSIRNILEDTLEPGQKLSEEEKSLLAGLVKAQVEDMSLEELQSFGDVIGTHASFLSALDEHRDGIAEDASRLANERTVLVDNIRNTDLDWPIEASRHEAYIEQLTDLRDSISNSNLSELKTSEINRIDEELQRLLGESGYQSLDF